MERLKTMEVTMFALGTLFVLVGCSSTVAKAPTDPFTICNQKYSKYTGIQLGGHIQDKNNGEIVIGTTDVVVGSPVDLKQPQAVPMYKEYVQCIKDLQDRENNKIQSEDSKKN